MAKYDPALGEMIGVSEVSNLTGFTPHQIRSWRKPENYEKAIFKAYRDETSANVVWYRKDDVEAWRELKGISGGLAEIPAPNAFEAPVRNPNAVGEKKDSLTQLAKITTANAYTKWYQWYCDSSGLDYNTTATNAEKWQKQFWSIHTATPLDQVSKPPTRKQRAEQPEYYWLGWTWAMRRAYADVYSLDVSDEDIMSLPSGEVPPLKEVS